MTGFFVKKAFFDGWDNLLPMALVNLGYVLIIIAGLAVPMAFPSSVGLTVFLFLLVVFLFFLFSGGAARVMAETLYGRSPEFRNFISYCRDSWRTSVLLAAITSVQVVVLSIGFPFYLSMGGFLGMAALSILFWVSVLWWLVSLWMYPVSMQLEKSVKMQLKKSVILFLDNTGFTIFLGLYMLFNFFLSVVTAFLVPGFAGMHLARQIALKLRMYKYDYLEEHPGSDKQHIPWYELLDDERENMGRQTLKGMIFPWKE